MAGRRDRPRVSCIITTFDYAHFLPLAIDSALAQTFGEENLEIIVVDGASTDDTPQVVERYLPRVTYIREPSNEGVVSSANRGLDAASGDLIAFLNADDVWYPTTVERLVARLAARPDSGLVYGDMEMIGAEGESLHRSYYEQFGIRPEGGRLLGRLLRGNFIASGCFMFRAELLPECHPIPDWAPWEDWYIMLRLAHAAHFDYLPEPVLRYRFHGANQVLMAQGDRLLGTWQKELAFRRRVLAELEPHAISVDDLVGAIGAFDETIRRLADAAPDRLENALPIEDADRAFGSEAAAAASSSERGGDADAAVFHLARALAHDPGDETIRRWFAGVATPLLDKDARAADQSRSVLRAALAPPPAAILPTEPDPLDEAIRHLAHLTARVAGTAPEPRPTASAPAGMAERAERVDSRERAATVAELWGLRPWTQGPFPAGGGLELGRRATPRHEELLRALPDDLKGRKVLDVSSNAGYVAFALSVRAPDQVVACEPRRFHRQALALDRLYSSGVDFRPLGWQDLDPHEVGRFDLIHADGLLDEELQPILALEHVRNLLADDARLYLGFTRISDASRAEYLRLVETGRRDRVLALPGRTALNWMIEAAGLRSLREFGVGPSELTGIPVECGYLELAL